MIDIGIGTAILLMGAMTTLTAGLVKIFGNGRSTRKTVKEEIRNQHDKCKLDMKNIHDNLDHIRDSVKNNGEKTDKIYSLLLKK